MRVSILKYNAGNIRSVLFALERLGVDARVTDDPEEILGSDRIIFPGVGEASSAMAYLRERKLDTLIASLTQPVLGICLGMQLLCRHSEEGNTKCLGIFDTEVKRFPPGLKVPQVGWNAVYDAKGPLFKNMEPSPYCYFVHSYYAGICEDTISTTDYGLSFSSGLQKNNFFGLQFHAEKSSLAGEKMIKNFIEL